MESIIKCLKEIIAENPDLTEGGVDYYYIDKEYIEHIIEFIENKK